MSTEDVVIAFLRKEPLTKGSFRSNGEKLLVENTCIGMWYNHRVLMNDTFYGAEIKRYQDLLFKWLRKSDIIYTLVTDVPKTKHNLVDYYGE